MKTNVSKNGKRDDTAVLEDGGDSPLLERGVGGEDGIQITLKSIKLLNFKGIRNLQIDFGNTTTIGGENATGKTTVLDAFTFLLFGKDSADRKDFNIKTLDAHNQPIPKIDHEVTGLLSVDGIDVELRRVFREKWVKKRGEETAEMTGHETEYYCNGVPLSQAEYNERVADILSEHIAKLITSPLYFNTMKWQDRRQVLSDMAGEISDRDIAGNSKEFQLLLDQVTNKTLIEYKREIAASKKRIKADLETIPARIDELNRSLPEMDKWEDIKLLIASKTERIYLTEKAIENKSEAYEAEFAAIQVKQNEKHQLEMKLDAMRMERAGKKNIELSETKGKLRETQSAVLQCDNNLTSIERSTATNLILIKRLTGENTELRISWTNRNEETVTIDPKELACPSCKRKFEAGKIETISADLLKNFNADKARRLKMLEDKGFANKAEIALLEKQNTDLQNDKVRIEAELVNHRETLAALQAKIEAHDPAMAAVPSAAETALSNQIAAFIIPSTPVVDTTALRTTKSTLQAEIKDLEKRLAVKDQIDRTNARIAELSDEERTLSQKLADLERTEFCIDRFNKAKIETIEQRINGLFSLVKFKMFETQINGGEVECCECMVNGVPYSDVNTAGKINAGLDIINALSAYYHIYAPVWIDNRESINTILPGASQVINLVVTKQPKLTVQAA